MSTAKPTLMRVNAIGYGGRPSTIMCAIDPSTGVLLVSKEMPVESKPRAGMFLVSNDPRDEHRESLFTEESFDAAIEAYFRMDSAGLLKILPTAQQADPKARIERDGLNERGTKYRLHPDITCAQVATLMACHAASTQENARRAEDFMADLMTLTTIM